MRGRTAIEASGRSSQAAAPLSPLLSELQHLRGEHAVLSKRLIAAAEHVAALEKDLSLLMQAHGAPKTSTTRRTPALLEDGDGDGDAGGALESPSTLPWLAPQAITSPAEPGLDALLAEMASLSTTIHGDERDLDRLTQRISALEQWAFEEISEPLQPGRERVLAGILDPGAAENETFRLFGTKFQALVAERRLRCVGVISGSPGEGKSTVAMGLGLITAMEPARRVLLIEAELRKPSLERLLGVPPRAGLSEWLAGAPGPLRVRRLEPSGLALISAGMPVARSSELIRAGRMAQLLDAARHSYDLVLVDCPPPAPRADAVLLQDLLDGFLLVVRARHSPRDQIRAAIDHLRSDKILAVVFNDHNELLPRSYSRGYTSPHGRI